jgi:hypothetical protein
MHHDVAAAFTTRQHQLIGNGVGYSNSIQLTSADCTLRFGLDFRLVWLLCLRWVHFLAVGLVFRLASLMRSHGQEAVLRVT